MTLPAVRRAVCYENYIGRILAQRFIGISRFGKSFGPLEAALPVRSHGVRIIGEAANRTLHLRSVLRPSAHDLCIHRITERGQGEIDQVQIGMLGVISGIQSINQIQQGGLSCSYTCPVHVVLPHAIRHIEHNDDVCALLCLLFCMAGDIQPDRIGAVPVRFDLLVGSGRYIIQSRRRRTRRCIAAATFLGIVDVNITAVLNLYRSRFARIPILIIRNRDYLPCAISILPDDRISQYNPVSGILGYIPCAGVVISVDIYSKVYRRGRSIYCGGRIEFYEFIILI